MLADERGPVESVAAAILKYLEAHPLAADTAEGVARWWLGPTDPTVTVAQVERALKLLESRRAVQRLTLIDGTILYSQAQVERH